MKIDDRPLYLENLIWPYLSNRSSDPRSTSSLVLELGIPGWRIQCSRNRWRHVTPKKSRPWPRYLWGSISHKYCGDASFGYWLSSTFISLAQLAAPSPVPGTSRDSSCGRVLWLQIILCWSTVHHWPLSNWADSMQWRDWQSIRINHASAAISANACPPPVVCYNACDWQPTVRRLGSSSVALSSTIWELAWRRTTTKSGADTKDVHETDFSSRDRDETAVRHDRDRDVETGTTSLPGRYCAI